MSDVFSFDNDVYGLGCPVMSMVFMVFGEYVLVPGCCHFDQDMIVDMGWSSTLQSLVVNKGLSSCGFECHFVTIGCKIGFFDVKTKT